jgi:small subunit ribosomal protein S8
MDTLSNMLNSIKTASRVGKTTIEIPHSKLKASVLECLQKEGYITSFKIINPSPAQTSGGGKKSFPIINIQLAYNGDKPRVTEIIRVSKPSRRMYAGAKELKPFKNGFGRIILSTPKGIMSERDARTGQVGGEVLFKIW